MSTPPHVEYTIDLWHLRPLTLCPTKVKAKYRYLLCLMTACGQWCLCVYCVAGATQSWRQPCKLRWVTFLVRCLYMVQSRAVTCNSLEAFVVLRGWKRRTTTVFGGTDNRLTDSKMDGFLCRYSHIQCPQMSYRRIWRRRPRRALRWT